MKVLENTPDRLVIKQSGGRFMILFGLAFLIIGMATFFILGQTRTVTCTRLEPQQVQCEIAATFLGIPLRTRTVNQFQSAYMAESRDSDGDTTYQVILAGREGESPLTSYYSSGYGDKQEVVEQLNQFVNGADPTIMVRDSPGFFNYLFGFMFMGGGLFVLGFGLQQHTYTLDRMKNQFVHTRRGVLGRKTQVYQLDEIAGAFVEQSDTTYRPVVTLHNGEAVPLTQVYSSGRQSKEELVQAITTFLDRQDRDDAEYSYQ